MMGRFLMIGYQFRVRPRGSVFHAVSDDNPSLTICGQRFESPSWRRWLSNRESLCRRCEGRITSRGLWDEIGEEA